MRTFLVLTIAAITMLTLAILVHNDRGGGIRAAGVSAEASPGEDASDIRPAFPENVSPPEREARENDSELTQPAADPERASVPVYMEGEVRSSDDAPLTGALVNGEGGLELVSTMEDGRYRLRRSGHVVGTHPGHLATAVRIAGDAAPPVLELERAKKVNVSVVSASGSPVSGVRIESSGQVPLEGSQNESVPVERSTTTDDGGLAVVAALPGTSELVAIADGLRSEVWVGDHRSLGGPLVLTLGESFSASGRIIGAPSAEILADSIVRVRKARDEEVWNRPSHDWRQYAAFTGPESDATWSLPSIPWTGPGTYIFRLESSGSLPVEVSQQLLSPEETPSIDLTWAAGNPLSFLVVDEEGEGLSGVDLVANWDDAGQWTRRRVVTDAEGRAAFDAVPAASVWVRASRKGRANTTFGVYTPPTDTGEFTVTLDPAAVIHGICTSDGEPVSEFTITYWGEDSTGRSTRSFSDRTDGSFTIDDAPSGELHLFAHAPDMPASETLDLDAPGGEPIEVELELTEGLSVQGKVIDARDGRPITQAVIEARHRAGPKQLEPWGPRYPVGPDGTFEGIKVSSFSSFMSISAPDYMTHRVDPSTIGGGVTRGVADAGIISLFPTRKVSVQLVSDTVDDFSGYQATLWGRTGMVKSDPEGRIAFEGQGPGHALLLVYTPERHRIDTELNLSGNEEWKFRVSVGTPRTIAVRLVPADGVEVPHDAWLSSVHTDLTGTPSRCLVEFDDENMARLNYAVGQTLLLSAVRTSGEVIAVRRVSIEDSPVVEIDLHLDGTTRNLLLLDQEEQPVAGATVELLDPAEPHLARVRFTSDVNGRVKLQSVAEGPVGIRVSSGSSSYFAPQALHLETDEDPIIVRLDSSASVRATLVERGKPAVGVPVRLMESGGWRMLLAGTSDTTGLAQFNSLSPDLWDLHVSGGGWWPTKTSIRASETADPTPVEVRRMGGLEVLVSREGFAVSGAAVSLVSTEQDEPVQTWLDEGRAFAGPTGLVTDNTGKVDLNGLPNGPYTWTVTLSDGTSLQGTCHVPAGDTNQLSVAF